MKMKKRILSMMLVAVMMLALTACGGMTTDDAKTYVQSVLDAGLKQNLEIRQKAYEEYLTTLK